MLDYLASKIGYIIAGIAILGLFTGLILWEINYLYSVEVDEHAETLAEEINGMGNKNIDYKWTLTFNEDEYEENNDRNYLYMNTLMDKDEYKVEIYSNLVRIKVGDDEHDADLTVSVHFWNPGDSEEMSSIAIEKADRLFPNIKFGANRNIIFERRTMMIESVQKMIFIYSEGHSSAQSQLDTIAREIESNSLSMNVDMTMSRDEQPSSSFEMGPYDFLIDVHEDLIVSEIDGAQVVRYVSCDHYWNPDEMSSWTESSMNNKDLEKNVMSPIFSSNTLRFEGQYINLVGGTEEESTYETFLYY